MNNDKWTSDITDEETPYYIRVNGKIWRNKIESAGTTFHLWQGLNLGMGDKATLRNYEGRLVAKREGF
jgi:hypothetical protein